MILIRKFRPADLNRVYEIECKSFKDPYNVLFLLNLYELYSETFLVAEKNGVVVGYVIARQVDGKGHVIAIAVEPKHRCQGIGKALMEAIMRIFESVGVREVFLEVRVSNIPAIKFYENLGFKKEEILPAYYSDGEDGVLLRKSFS
jgi:ribosomal-protein-alanine N-acetyltransferase